MNPPPLRFTEEDSDKANDDWGANCGPHALAAACGTTLAVVRLVMPDFRGWMSPTHIKEALERMAWASKVTTRLKTKELCQGINRIQWEGRWLNPGVPARVAYFHTHWVARRGDFVLCTAQPLFGWIELATWQRVVDAVVVGEDGITGWHVTHHYEMPRPERWDQSEG